MGCLSNGMHFLKAVDDQQGASRLGGSLFMAVLYCVLTAAPVVSFGAETLPGLVRDAFAQHPALRSRQGLEEVAQAGIDVAKREFWAAPSIAVERADASANDTSYQGDEQVVTLQLKQPLWTGGRLTGTLSKAEAQALVAKAELEITRQQLALRIVQAWSDVFAAQSTVAAYEQSRNTHTRLLEMVKRRHDEGVTAKADMELARSRLETVLADLSSSNARLDTSLELLRVLTGRPVDPAALVVGVYDIPRQDRVLQAARERSPLVVKAQAQAKMAEAEIKIARAALWPEVSLRAERQYGNFTQADADPQNRIFITVNASLGGGGSNISAVEGARAQYRAAVEEIHIQQLAVDEQVLSDLALAHTLAPRKASLQRARQSADDVSSSWERQFLAGRKQWQDLMNAAREQAQADTQLADVLGAEQLTGWRLKVLTEGVDALIRLHEYQANE